MIVPSAGSLNCMARFNPIVAKARRNTDLTPTPGKNRPLFIVHDTVDGLIYSRAERRGKKWFARHWGDELDGGGEFLSMRQANDFLTRTFNEMFPEHRCTTRCRLNPEEP